MVDIQFGELPPSKGHASPGKYVPIADALRARPGEWALISSDGWSSSAHYIQKGVLLGFQPRGAFQAVLRNRRIEDGQPRFDVWVRYVGDQS